MKVAISSRGKDLSSDLDPRFGRAAYFLIIDLENMRAEAYENENANLGGGAGVQAAQFVASKGAGAVITGNCGPNAIKTCSAAGIQVYVGLAGSVKDIVEKYKNGELTPTTQASAPPHAGMGATGMGRGKGMGRGSGRGQGGGPGGRSGSGR